MLPAAKGGERAPGHRRLAVELLVCVRQEPLGSERGRVRAPVFRGGVVHHGRGDEGRVLLEQIGLRRVRRRRDGRVRLDPAVDGPHANDPLVLAERGDEERGFGLGEVAHVEQHLALAVGQGRARHREGAHFFAQLGDQGWRAEDVHHVPVCRRDGVGHGALEDGHEDGGYIRDAPVVLVEHCGGLFDQCADVGCGGSRGRQV